MSLAPGTFHTVTNQTLFGAIGDSAPDRWGRVLMRRAEIARAKKAGEVPHTLREVDFLLGVNDEARGRLSPVYDINPTPLDIRPRILTTMIDLYDSTASIDLAMSVAADFRISNKQAKLIVNKMAKTISEWQNVAQSFNIPKREIDRMASSFEHNDLKKALTY